MIPLAAIFVSFCNRTEILNLNCFRIAVDGSRVAYEFDNRGDAAYAPLGMTIDVDGYLYAAAYYGGEVLKINPRCSCSVERCSVTFFELFNFIQKSH